MSIDSRFITNVEYVPGKKHIYIVGVGFVFIYIGYIGLHCYCIKGLWCRFFLPLWIYFPDYDEPVDTQI